MTILERIEKAIHNLDCNTDNIDKLIALAYFVGKERATKEVSDEYKKLLAEQRERAKNCRYHNMVAEIIGDKEYIYFCDYGCEMTGLFGSDNTEI